MYSYKSFEIAGEFVLLRPVFITLLVASFIIFIFVVTPKLREKMVNGLAVVGLSIVSTLLAAQLLFYNGIIVDELGLGGDELQFDMAIVILLFSIVNPIVFFVMRSKSRVHSI
ncbi:hypothetical protein [Priestia taiwanensis]|uniref:Uncharacterized protein n=1 Tax=Priestia taiwanensis TaxID=1347902 RepID=A0A917AW05_9BACI|nr:hypothetical protein [Priestia taiwanensis]MBM7364716.1 putative membrane protein [Priestia taiwanensis]GGE79075.1 hypothetical protein GCM10007140_30800 [Priestia taiwanensis]